MLGARIPHHNAHANLFDLLRDRRARAARLSDRCDRRFGRHRAAFARREATVCGPDGRVVHAARVRVLWDCSDVTVAMAIRWR